jgi:glycosyltransferase involved in cell wall biosynthesis
MSSQDEPTFSVVIPTYGRPDLLARCLGALGRMDLPAGGFEVIVVDDGSPVRLDAVVAEHSGSYPLRLCRKQNAGPASARNFGARVARGDWLAFLDDDCVPKPGWLKGFEAARAMHPCGAAGGGIANTNGDTICSVASNLLLGYLYDYYNRPGARTRFYATANLACSKRSFLEMGGFDESFRIAAAEDRDFCDRWLDCEHPMVYSPEALVDHAPQLSLRRFIRQHFNYGRGAHHLHMARRRRGLARPRVEPMSFYRGLLGSATGRPPNRSRLALLVLLAMTQVIYVTGYISERALAGITSPD